MVSAGAATNDPPTITEELEHQQNDEDGAMAPRVDNENNDDELAVAQIADIAAAALQLQQQQVQQVQQVQVRPPPPPLPTGWVLRESKSNPNHYYYYHLETGYCTWQPPQQPELVVAAADVVDLGYQPTPTLTQQELKQQLLETVQAAKQGLSNNTKNESKTKKDHHSTNHRHHAEEDEESGNHNKKRKHHTPAYDPQDAKQTDVTNTKKQKSKSSNSNNKPPSKVRVLHILKKHKDSRRPTSWRMPKGITITKEEAEDELTALLELLHDVQHDQNELRATFQELARTESDCSSAKRGGDLGYFGPKKMQPNFEKASFKLDINELSGIVETNSGIHVLLRIG